MNETLDGVPVRFDEETDQVWIRQELSKTHAGVALAGLPHEGILEFDYVRCTR